MAPLNSRKLLFVDIPAGIVENADFDLTTPYLAYLSQLCTLSGRVADRLGGLPAPRTRGQGFTLNDGPWWYRVVHLVDANGDGAPGRLDKGEWKILNTPGSYHTMIEEVTNVDRDTGWVEMQHVSQSSRSLCGTPAKSQSVVLPKNERTTSP